MSGVRKWYLLMRFEAFNKVDDDKHLTNSIILIYWTIEFSLVEKYSIPQIEMPPLKLAISLLVMILGASGKKGGGGSAVSVEEMRELLVSSMQTTISLTQLVEQQTKRISEITSFVDDTKVLIEKLKEDLAASEERLAQKIEEVKESTR